MSGVKKLAGKVAIVTGGASGIGEATVRLFADLGARAVVIVDIQPEKGDSVAESIGRERCSYVNCDITDEEQVRSAIDWTVTTYGGVDVMFCNAGVAGAGAQTVLDLDLQQFDRVMRVNTRGTAACVKQAARKMVELGRGGAIICTASATANLAGPNLTDYIMSKRAVLGLMRSASLQLGGHGIRVNSVSPNLVVTPLAATIGLGTAAVVESVFGQVTSLKGLALTAEHVAEAVAFLASDEAAYITGHDLLVDGGLQCLPFMFK